MNNIENFIDNRGELKFINNPINIQQQFLSINHKNVLRGIHCSPYTKTIVCLKGKILDYIIDLKNLTYKKYFMKENSKLCVPANYAHMFISFEDDTQVLYQLEGIYDSNKEININYRDPFLNLDIPWDVDYICSERDNDNKFIKELDYVILGGNGFLGSYTCKIMDKLNKSYIKLDTRLENIDLLYKQLSIFKPKYVISAAGISGKPTVQWCENNKDETYFINYTLQLELSKICKKLNIHLTIYGSGLIYNNKGLYNEEHEPNKNDLYYSKVRILLEKALKNENMFTNVLYLRILYPISGDGHKKCFLTKLKTRLESIHDVKINTTILSDLIPNVFSLVESKTTGIFNFVNPGLISISDLIKKFDNKIEFKVVEKNYDNPELDTTKLLEKCNNIKKIHDLKN